ncbi:MAG: DUF3024 domain-containing protein [Ferruginibacter sp.]
MALSLSILEYEIKKLTEAMRPPVELRDEVDVGYKFEKNSLEIFEIRPKWDDKSVMQNYPFAKARFIKSKSIWKIYWRRASGNWDLYVPNPEVRQVSDFFKLIDEDKHGVFQG